MTRPGADGVRTAAVSAALVSRLADHDVFQM
jgi:hypothetical protein